MKKALLLTGLALASALFISGCQREKDFADPTPTGPFNILLTLDDTRTVNDGISTHWEEGDQLSVFYAPAGSSSYSANTCFDMTDPEAGLASGDVELTGGRHDWYLLYPYSRGVGSPADRNLGGIWVGRQTQTQTGNDNKAHLAGYDMPLFGVAKDVPASQVPTVAMHQATTVVAVNVTNGSDEPLEVGTLILRAPCDIVGIYSIDFSSGEPVYTSLPDGDGVFSFGVLTVVDAEPIPVGGSARFYMALKPFTVSAGEVLTLEIYRKGTSKPFSRDLTLPGEVSFQPGHIKNLNITYGDKAQENRIRDILMQFYEAMDGLNWVHHEGWGTDRPLKEWDGVYSFDPLTCKISLAFEEFGLKGEIPESIGELGPYLEFLSFRTETGVTGTIPASFSRFSKMNRLEIRGTSMTSLRDCFSGMESLYYLDIEDNLKMAGPLPSSIGDCQNLRTIVIVNNGFTGPIPPSWAQLGNGSLLNMLDFELGNNHLSGTIPSYVLDAAASDPKWLFDILYQQGEGFDISEIDIPAYGDEIVKGQIEDINGKTFTFEDVFKKNKYTVYVLWASWCPFSRTLMPALKDYYEKYRQDGLEIIATSQVGGVDEDGAGHMLDDFEGYKAEVIERGYDQWYNYYWPDYGTSYLTSTPNAEVFDQNGYVIFSSVADYSDPVRNRFGKIASTDLIPFLETLLGPAEPADPYSSTDYSRDGEVLTLQQATVGRGINIVFMGDAYTDKDMAPGGVYETAMRQAMEEFFAIEPYKTFRNRFNVYAVKVVSPNGRIGADYRTALGTYFGSGTFVDGDDDKCYEYALRVPGIDSRDNLLVNVMVNTNRNAGTAILYKSDQSGVARFPSFGNDPYYFGSTLRHEAGGHGFAFLADEYSQYSQTPPATVVEEYNALHDQYGWYANVDFTDDPAKIRWSAFLSDTRYQNEVGIHEGAALYERGAWRPSVNSMMRENMEYFNAPSRWAIYQQIMKRSGEEYSFDKFLEYDAVNRGKAQAAAPRPPLKAARRVEPGAPPVIKP